MERTKPFPVEGNAAAFSWSMLVTRAGKETREVPRNLGDWHQMTYLLEPYEVTVVRVWQQVALMAAAGRLVTDPKVMDGVPVVRNTRIPAHVILDCLADGDTVAEVAARFPALTPEDVSAVLAYAAGLAGG